MNEFKSIVAIVAYGLEAFGVLIIVLGSGAATVRVIPQLRSRTLLEIYHEYRQVVGRSILLGLEFLIAGDVIRTVIVSHTLSNVAVLALIVVMRAFLSFTLALEIEGKLPWSGSAEKTSS
ncbi:MAG: DUF1622 domain-containing protein [Pseudomonadota bacterium]|nr:DUF1622 domain-containing protein [Pseudomonadota bacterium]